VSAAARRRGNAVRARPATIEPRCQERLLEAIHLVRSGFCSKIESAEEWEVCNCDPDPEAGDFTLVRIFVP
jgi:hypothetical protein